MGNAEGFHGTIQEWLPSRWRQVGNEKTSRRKGHLSGDGCAGLIQPGEGGEVRAGGNVSRWGLMGPPNYRDPWWLCARGMRLSWGQKSGVLKEETKEVSRGWIRKNLFWGAMPKEYGILIPQPGIEPTPLFHWEHGVLITRPPGKSRRTFFAMIKGLDVFLGINRNH